MSKRYLVIAECVDHRTNKRFYPGDEFTPAPDAKQAARLIKAECIEPIDGDAPDFDDLATSSDQGVADIAKAEKVDVSTAKGRDEMIALIRAARSVSADGLDGLDTAGLIERANAAHVQIADGADDAAIRAAIRAKAAG